LNLRWDKCFGDGGVQYRDFACDTNVGVELLVGTFELAADLQAVNGLECFLDIGAVLTERPWTGCLHVVPAGRYAVERDSPTYPALLASPGFTVPASRSAW
jgi:hypothetical protein